MRARTRWTRSAVYGLAAVAGLCGVALASPHGEGCEKGRPLKRIEGRLETLGLEPQTLETARGLLDQAREERRESRDEIHAARERMRELMLEEKPDVDAVMAQVDAIGSLETSAKKAKLRTLLAIRALLTPEQWTQLVERPAGGRGHHKRHLF